MTDQATATRARIAQRLREARKLAGLSQGQVAKLLDLHRPSISEIEAGNRRVSADELARFAEIYDVNAEWLLGKAPEILETDDPRLELAARQLSKLKASDLDRLLRLLAAMRSEDGRNKDGGNL
ncbi:MAG: helix-turn-helix transcriptional regulator [Gammaproteobacteria bacterium]|nr:helix-turn-helix transcriptional regulator [Gammaproteobacteria bacterium]